MMKQATLHHQECGTSPVRIMPLASDRREALPPHARLRQVDCPAWY
jgi:hypothetical protein